jgi:hypothetical protein
MEIVEDPYRQLIIEVHSLAGITKIDHQKVHVTALILPNGVAWSAVRTKPAIVEETVTTFSSVDDNKLLLAIADTDEAVRIQVWDTETNQSVGFADTTIDVALKKAEDGAPEPGTKVNINSGTDEDLLLDSGGNLCLTWMIPRKRQKEDGDSWELEGGKKVKARLLAPGGRRGQKKVGSATER